MMDQVQGIEGIKGRGSWAVAGRSGQNCFFKIKLLTRLFTNCASLGVKCINVITLI